MRNNIVFFVPEWCSSDSSILHSQVLSVASFLSGHNYDCLFIGSDIDCEAVRTNTLEIENKYNIKCSLSVNPYGYAGVKNQVLCTKNTLAQHADKITDFSPDIIYTRSLFASFFIRGFSNKHNFKTWLDVRAVLSAEIELKHGRRTLGYWVIRYLEWLEFSRAERLSCVSNKLASYIKSKLTANKEIEVIPSCFHGRDFYFDKESRDRIRSMLGLKNDEKLVCYSGGISAWQKAGTIAEVFRDIKYYTDNVKLLFLTKDVEAFKRLLEDKGIPPNLALTKSCSQKEVKDYLSASDAGIILRDDIIVNNVASPLKVAEYLICGLPVIMSPNIGDLSDLVEENAVGLLVDLEENIARKIIDYVESNLDVSTRERCIKLANEYFDRANYLESYNKLF
ncbi:MAG: glycosyltransferase [Sedimenticola sp.]